MARKAASDSIRKFLDDLWNQAQRMLKAGKVKTEKAAQTAGVKMDLYLVEAKMADLYHQLGEVFYETSKRKNPSVRKQALLFAILDEIREIENRERSLRHDLKRRLTEGRRRAEKKAEPPSPKKLAAGKATGRKKAARRGRPPKKAAATNPASSPAG
jgi:small-conductance mechanosensitive channel